MPFGNRKNIFDDLFSSVILKFRKYHPSGNLEFHKLGIFQSLKLRNLMGRILQISLKLNVTSNTLGCNEVTAQHVCGQSRLEMIYVAQQAYLKMIPSR